MDVSIRSLVKAAPLLIFQDILMLIAPFRPAMQRFIPPDSWSLLFHRELVSRVFARDVGLFSNNGVDMVAVKAYVVVFLRRCQQYQEIRYLTHHSHIAVRPLLGLKIDSVRALALRTLLYRSGELLG